MDRSLVKDLEQTRSAQAIIKHLVALCHDLGIRAVCEGVERQSQADFLSDVLCDKAQASSTRILLRNGESKLSCETNSTLQVVGRCQWSGLEQKRRDKIV